MEQELTIMQVSRGQSGSGAKNRAAIDISSQKSLLGFSNGVRYANRSAPVFFVINKAKKHG